jgi:integrase/recombinase XerD
MRDEHESKKVTGAPDVLTDHEIRRVFPIIEPTRHAERNRLAFVPSIYSGIRGGEIAALAVGDVATDKREVRREIKLGAHQTKGPKGRTVILSERVRKEIDAYLRTRATWRNDAPLIASQRNGRAFSTLSLSMLFN